jgi:hypothetical protein
MKLTPVLTVASAFAFAASLLAQQSPSTNANENATRGIGYARFSADGTQVTTASSGGDARVWDVATGKPVAPLNHEGTWQLVSFRYGEATIWSNVPEGQRRIKLINQTHFSWVQYEVSSGKAQTMAGGTYTLKQGAYTEAIEYAGEGMTEYLGKSQLFTLRVEGDRLHQSGRLSDGTQIEEVWQRVKSGSS